MSQVSLTPEQLDRRRRMQWWHEGRFGMFIHWGLYSVLGRHEWAMNRERIPVAEYEKLADQFKPAPRPARQWARLAREAGQKYMVLTTNHHEGFCLFNSALTDYCAPKRAVRRDLVGEYVEAARAESLGVGFYYSLMDWHHPDGARCATDEAARRRFVDYIHGQVRELCTNYGKIDILWYDVAWPLSAEGWESAKMNAMVRQLQPDIIINNRSKLPEDFGTPEQHVTPEAAGRAWEACMTINNSWGYNAADREWKPLWLLLTHLQQAATGAGNFLLNIGPKPDGSVPAPCAKRLRQMGDWLRRNGESLYGQVQRPALEHMMNVVGNWTVKGHTAYLHVHAWPGNRLVLGGFQTKILAARILGARHKLKIAQDADRVILTGLPGKAPDKPVSVIALDCDGPPRQALGAGMVTLP